MRSEFYTEAAPERRLSIPDMYPELTCRLFGRPPLRFGGATGSSIFFGLPPLRLTGAGGSMNNGRRFIIAALPLLLLCSIDLDRISRPFPPEVNPQLLLPAQLHPIPNRQPVLISL